MAKTAKKIAAAEEPAPAVTFNIDTSKWPADKTEIKPIDSLTPYEKNARTHSPKQVDEIVASIMEWGWTMPIVVDEDGLILAGHGRVMAARKLGLTGVPCVTARGWSDEKKRAYILADNQLALNSGWDEALLSAEMLDLQEAGFNLSLMGFDDVRLGELLNPPSDSVADPEHTPEPPTDPITRPGEVWLLGPHRIICGDSTDEETVEALLQGAKPHLMVTDQPYGVEYDATWRKDQMPDTNPGKTGGMHGKVENDNRADWREAWDLFPGEVAYVWCASLHIHTVAEGLLAMGFNLRSSIIWAKQQFVIGRGDYHWQHEPCWYAVREGGKGHWNGDRKQTTIWEIDKPQKSETGHSTQKPIECMLRPIENNSKPGDAVYEPFSGSGTTIIACEMSGRRAYAIEINPAYVDVAISRWEAFTGQAATLEGDGRTFLTIAGERVKAGGVKVKVAMPPQPKNSKAKPKMKAAAASVS